MNLQEQLQDVKDRLAQLDPNNRDNLVEIAKLKAQQSELTNQAAQEQAAQVRIQDATEQAAYFLDNLVIEDLTMRELCVGELQYQMLRIAVQNKIIDLAEEASKQISEVQAEENAQQNALKNQIASLHDNIENGKSTTSSLLRAIETLNAEVSQLKLEKEDAETKRDAAVRELDESKTEITRLEGHIDELRKEMAVGARNAYKVTDVEQSEQLKQLADQIKASRIHVYDVVPDNEINPKNYTAKRADTGAEVTYNWTQTRNYIEIKDAAEVERFRQQFANQEAVSDIPLDQPVQDNVTPEATFPELPRAEAPNIPGEVPVVIPTPESSGQGKTVEERVAALEKRVVELEKVCNLNEEAA